MNMLKRCGVWLTSLVLSASLGAAEPLVVGVNSNDKPFCWTNERGELTGFSYDVAQAICRAMGTPCKFVSTKFADFIPGVVERRFDFVVGNVLRTPAREQQVDFTKRFWRSSSMFVGKPGVARDTSPAGLKGKVVAVQQGSVQEKYLLERYQGSVRLLTFPTNTERNAALAAGKADLMFGSTVSHYAFLTTPEGAAFEFVGAPIDAPGLGGDVAIPLAKGRPDLLARLNAAIDAIVRDGTFAKINNTYFATSVF